MSSKLTYVVDALERLKPFDTRTFRNEESHEEVTVWHTEWLLTRNTLPNIKIRHWYVCGPDTPLSTHHNIMDAARKIGEELEDII